MNKTLLAMAAIAGLAAAESDDLSQRVILKPDPPKPNYEPGSFRWRDLRRSYSRTLMKRLRKPK